MVSTAVMAHCPAKTLQPSDTLHTKVHCHVPQLAPADQVCHFRDDGCLPRALWWVLARMRVYRVRGMRRELIEHEAQPSALLCIETHSEYIISGISRYIKFNNPLEYSSLPRT